MSFDKLVVKKLDWEYGIESLSPSSVSTHQVSVVGCNNLAAVAERLERLVELLSALAEEDFSVVGSDVS
jgi:hypothetical protein